MTYPRLAISLVAAYAAAAAGAAPVKNVLFIATSSAAPSVCDIFASSGTPCVAAHSTTRALFASFSSALYRVLRVGDNATVDVKPRVAGGVADVAPQDSLCHGADCVITVLFDQTNNGNHITPAAFHVHSVGTDKPVNASRDPLTLGGSKVYSAFFEGGMGYRNDRAVGTATGDDAQTIYMVTSGLHFNEKCCFDYGNAETVPVDDGPGTMEALYFGSAKGGLNHGGVGPGPWVMGDLEKGLWGSDVVNSTEPSISHAFVTAMFKGDSGAPPGHMAIKGGDAQAGALRVYYDGQRPPLYAPMKKQGSIILGIGGDNSDGSIGTFYEGAMVRGFTSDATDAAVAANIVASGYALAMMGGGN